MDFQTPAIGPGTIKSRAPAPSKPNQPGGGGIITRTHLMKSIIGSRLPEKKIKEGRQKMKINFLKAVCGTEREREAIEDIPKFQKIPHQGTSPASREQKRQRFARRITRRNHR